MKYFYSTLIFFILGTCFSFSQTRNIKGIVLTEGYAPLEYANVAVVNANGGVVGSATCDSLGRFNLAMDADATLTDKTLAVSYVGYEKYQCPIDKEDMGIIVLRASSNELQEVTVKGDIPAYTTNGSTLVANIQNSVLQDAGSAMDVLRQLPLVKVKDNIVTVFGKGGTTVYVNNREIRDIGEFNKIHSKNIKKVDIITNPGAQYSASTDAVIRIYTKSAAEGFSLLANAYVQKGRKWNESFLANMSYAGERYAIFADYSILDLRIRQDQETSVAINGTQKSTILSNDLMNLKRKQHSLSLGTEYKLTDKSTIGMKYDHSFLTNARYNIYGTMAGYSGSERLAEYVQQSYYKPKGNSGNVNVFYNGKDIRGWDVAFNADYSFGDNKTAATYDDTELVSEARDTVNSDSENKYHLLAAKLELSRTIGKGNFSMGADYSNTRNESLYGNDNLDLQEDLPSTRTLNKQNQMALFASYGRSFGNFNLQVGLRYELVSQNYFINDAKQEEQSKTYSNLFPTISVSNLFWNKLNMTLSYRRKVNRPSYYQLRGDVQYNSPFSYEAGNPLLKNTFVDDISYVASYSSLSLFMSYKIYHDKVLFAIEQFGDKAVTMSSFTNIDDFKKFSVSAVWSPTFFKIWSPQVETGVEKQFLKVDDGGTRSYNHPYFYISLNNVLSLPHDISFVVQAKYWSSYHSDLNREKEASYFATYIQKPFFNNAMVLKVGTENVFNTYKEKWTMSYKNVDYAKNAHDDNRFMYLSLMYRFHSSKGYSGKGTRNSEQNRLNML